jgi:hypothetical protein
MQVLGKYLIYAGIVLIFAGIILYFFTNHLNWLGKLPGDIKIEKENFRFYFPVTSMIIISIILTIIINIIRKLF